MEEVLSNLEIKKTTFEENFILINELVQKRKYKWQLKGIMDFDDVSQQILSHIFIKWELYDSTQPLKNWINKIITCQLINLARNKYYRFSRPCLKCAFNCNGDDSCGYTESGIQDKTCKIFKKWVEKKKSSADINLPVSVESHFQEVFDMPSDIHKSDNDLVSRIHILMEQGLKEHEFRIYKCLYIDLLTEEQTAEKLGFISSEKGRKPGYARIKQVEKIILEKVKKLKDKLDL